jgi:hypothetical protein
MLPRLTGLAALLVLAPSTVSGASSDQVRDTELKVKYKISFIGFDLARANLITKFEHGYYAARIGYRTTGIVKVFATATGDISATGAIDANHVMPAEFNQATKENSKDSKVVMTLSQGSVVSNEAEPEAPADPNRIQVKDEHRRNVFDPLSSMLIPLGKGKDALQTACNRTIPVFDGWTRFNIAMTFKELKTLDKGPFKGDVAVCSVRWVPVAGHIPTRAGTKFMMDNKDISVTLAPIGDTGYVAPLHIGLQTLHGHVDVDAVDFSIASPEPNAAN